MDSNHNCCYFIIYFKFGLSKTKYSVFLLCMQHIGFANQDFFVNSFSLKEVSKSRVDKYQSIFMNMYYSDYFSLS